MVSSVLPGAGDVCGVEDVAEVLRGEGAEVVAGDEGQVVVVRRAAAAGRYLREELVAWLLFVCSQRIQGDTEE